MGRPSSLHEGFVSVKTPMGLERFEVEKSRFLADLNNLFGITSFSLSSGKGVGTRGDLDSLYNI